MARVRRRLGTFLGGGLDSLSAATGTPAPAEPTSNVGVIIEMQFGGPLGAWTDVSQDVMMSVGTSWDYGLPGSRPTDLVANTGMLRIAMDNSERNSVGLIGYYSPGHVNCRAGFGENIGVRLKLTYLGIAYQRYTGWLDSIVPVPGRLRSRLVSCVAVDWFEDAAFWPVKNIPTQVDKRADELLTTLIATMPRAPVATSFSVGVDTFPYAFDRMASDLTAMGVAQQIVQSELGYLYQRGNGTLVFEDRHRRSLTSVDEFQFDDTKIFEMMLSRSRSAIVNQMQVTTHPRRAGASATTVLYASTQPIRIPAGGTVTVVGSYRDPSQLSVAIGGTDFVDPLVASVDYVMNRDDSGGGDDITGEYTVTALFAGDKVEITMTNTSGREGWAITLQARGRPLFAYDPIVSRKQDVASIDDNGLRSDSIDLPLQSDPNVGQSVANALVNFYKDPATRPTSVTFCANLTDAFMRAALMLDVGSRIGVAEYVSAMAISVGVGYFIQRVSGSIVDGLLWITWQLAPSDTSSYWVLGRPGASELGITTRLSYA